MLPHVIIVIVNTIPFLTTYFALKGFVSVYRVLMQPQVSLLENVLEQILQKQFTFLLEVILHNWS